MTTSADIALSRVVSEDAQKQADRIAKYQGEIDGALNAISEMQEANKQSVTLRFSCGHGYGEATRVREALIELGYECSNVVNRQGDWINGAGYHHYLAFDVKPRQAAQ